MTKPRALMAVMFWCNAFSCFTVIPSLLGCALSKLDKWLLRLRWKRAHAWCDGHSEGYRKGRKEERERAQAIIGGFTELDDVWKVVLCGAIGNPDWPVGERGIAFYEKLEAIREGDE